MDGQVTHSIQDAAIKVWEFPNIQALASYILKVASDRDLFFKHIAWKNMSKEHLSPRFLGYWGQVPASGDQGYARILNKLFLSTGCLNVFFFIVFSCQTCFMAYDTHIARCVVPHHERHRYVYFGILSQISCQSEAFKLTCMFAGLLSPL